MAELKLLSQELAEAFLAGEWSKQGLAARGALALGEERAPRWLRSLAQRLVRHFQEGPPRQREALEALIREDEGLDEARRMAIAPLTIRHYPIVEPTMRPATVELASFGVPSLPTPGDLASFLHLRPEELDWFAGIDGRAGRTPEGPLSHYTYHWSRKAAGSYRLLEAPKPRLKAILRCVLHEILDRALPHRATHGFRQGRSVLSHAAPHVGRALILSVDLRDFFASIPTPKIYAIFRSIGYPEAVARRLAGLTTNIVPALVWAGAPRPTSADEVDLRFGRGRFYRSRHLPQGAPTSPALANLAAFRLDLRLDAAAKAVGAVYTRYADDLAFSGDESFARGASSFYALVCRIVAEEGFVIQGRKTRFLRQGVRQKLTGVVVNAHPNVPRDEYDRLKAILHNCRRFGPESQNREGIPDFRAHLAGRVAWVATLNPERGRKLQEAFQAIDWGSSSDDLEPAETDRDPL